MKIRKFNEDVTDGDVNDPYQNEEGFINRLHSVSIFTDIEGDLENMSPEEAEDYLMSIITFCNQQLQGYKNMED